MKTPDFLRGFAKPKPTPIQNGDWVRHTETKITCHVLNIHGGLIYGRTSNGMLTVGKIEKFEKI